MTTTWTPNSQDAFYRTEDATLDEIPVLCSLSLYHGIVLIDSETTMCAPRTGMNMDYDGLCARLFSADKRIRYATVTDSRCNILAGGMRSGVQPLESSPEAAQRVDLQVAVLDGIMQAWAESIGRARFALIRHEKAYMLIIPFEDKHVELSIETNMSLEEIGGIVNLVESTARESSPAPS